MHPPNPIKKQTNVPPSHKTRRLKTHKNMQQHHTNQHSTVNHKTVVQAIHHLPQITEYTHTPKSTTTTLNITAEGIQQSQQINLTIPTTQKQQR